MNETISTLQKKIAGSDEACRKEQSRLATVIKNEINRLMNIKGRTELTVSELDTAADNSAKKYFAIIKEPNA